MKKINYIFITVIALAIVACSGMNDLHDKYLKDGEKIYLARFDSLKIYPGKERVKVFYWLSDPKVTSTIATWAMGEDSDEFPVQRTSGSEPNSFIIDGLGEGSYSFEFFNINTQYDLRSIAYKRTAITYGNSYQKALINTKPDKFTHNTVTDTYSFVIRTKYENVVAYEICYTKADGTNIADKRYTVKELTDAKGNMTIPIVLEGGSDKMDIKLRSISIPEETCIDEFFTDYDSFTLENPTIINK